MRTSCDAELSAVRCSALGGLTANDVDSGFETASVSESAPGISDVDVLDWAVRENRWLVTFDRDYGELIYRLRLRSPEGVIYLRLRPHKPEEPALLLLNLLQIEGLQFKERFTVVERGQIRQRPLPDK